MDTLFYFIPALEAIYEFVELGGDVLAVIAILTLFMWTLILERMFYLGNTHKARVSRALQAWETRPERKSWHAHQIREHLISVVSQATQRHLDLIKTLVALCPLLGLLGTVTGMIEVFELMAISDSENARSMADGISRATIPTMAGMVAALSGVATSLWLQNVARRERLLLAEHMTMDH